MATDLETTLRGFATNASTAEQEKCDRVIRMVKQAIDASPSLQCHSVRVFAQGSYRNLTNARLESDVDVCVFCSDTFYHNFTWAEGFIQADVQIDPATYSYAQYKSDVEAALVAKFGKSGVHRSNKAFDIHENSCRVDADVVACFEQRYYTKRLPNGTYDYYSGTHFISDDGNHVENWPEQNFENGVAKNLATSRRFKLIVRALKQIRYEMKDLRMAVAEPIPSFLVECLLYNTPNDRFGNPKFKDDMRAALEYLRAATLRPDIYAEWAEVNCMKYLFNPTQPWTVQQAHAFVEAVWQYLKLDYSLMSAIGLW